MRREFSAAGTAPAAKAGGLSLARLACTVLVAALLCERGVSAQTSPLTGAWESTIRVGERGEPLQAPIFAIYLPDGQFVQVTLPSNRPRLETPLDEMTRVELLARFRGAGVQRGTYRIDGDRLVRTNIAHLDPAAEGTETDLLVVQRDAFILRSPERGDQSEVRFRRLPSRGAANSLIVGVWERMSELNDAGEVRQPPNPPRVYYYSPDGFFASVQLPPNRPKTARPIESMTSEELLARFTRVIANAGTYSVAGNRLRRTETKHINPANEGRIESDVWRIEADVLIATSPEPGSRAESRFRRLTR